MNLSLFKLNKIIRSFIRQFTVLGIESSCDDTAVGIVSTDRKILAESKYNQWSVHKKLGYGKKKETFTGGVIPNVAKMLHRENLVLAVSDCIENIENGWNKIDAIALTTVKFNLIK